MESAHCALWFWEGREQAPCLWDRGRHRVLLQQQVEADGLELCPRPSFEFMN